MSLHPLKTTDHIRNTYLRYLKTIKLFQDDWLRSAFAKAIEEPSMLVKGPLVEISPPFKTSASIKDLVEENILSPLFQQLCTPENLPYERALYLHQEVAVRKLVAGRNVVVATGTGSGKTEIFLLPILNHLLREKEAGTLHKPGVRALLLYPMNALANDQIKRLRGLLGHYPHITFGRYIGETQHQPERAKNVFEQNYPQEPLVENELLSREEMQKTPPHILLTNYAMLEYLLLRPADSSLFDGAYGQHWKSIVLDEAHVYDGAKSTEIAMLLRRVQDRIVQSETGRLQVVATSATLGRGRQDFPDIVNFASNLFSQPFEWVEEDHIRQDVVEAEKVSFRALGKTWGRGTPELYRKLHDLLDDQRKDQEKNASQDLLNELKKVLENHKKVPTEVVDEALRVARQDEELVFQRFLYQLLRGDENLYRLQKRLQGEPAFLEDITAKLFPEAPEPAQVVIDLVALAVFARSNKEDMSLLPARYHVFARALEGAFICLNQERHKRPGQDSMPSLFLNRHKFCPHCGSRIFELANCTRCGTAYLIGDNKYGEHLKEEPSDLFSTDRNASYLVQNSAVYGMEATLMSYYVLQNQLSQQDDDEMVASEAENDDELGLEKYLLCPLCGQIQPECDAETCKCGVNLVHMSRVDIGRKRTLRRCVSCSTRSSGGVVYRFLTGQDAPVSVLVDALYQHLPPASDDGHTRYPGEGRKLLNFTDSRQNAAFFAPYLERSHQRNLRRRLVMKTIRDDPDVAREDLRLQDLLPRVLQQANKARVFGEEQSRDTREHTVAVWLMQEFSPLDRRISLEGLGLLKFQPVHPTAWKPPAFLTNLPWNLTPDQAFDLITLLLNTLRRQGAITYLRKKKEDLLQDDAFAPRKKAYYFREAERHPKKGVFGWMPAAGHRNARLDLLTRFLESQGLSEREVNTQANQTLKKIWEYLSTPNSQWKPLLPRELHSGHGYLYQLAHNMWEIVPATDDERNRWYICERCLNISPISLGGVCTTYGCQGTLAAINRYRNETKDNLYRDIYLHSDPIPMTAEEHTAQWTPGAAAEVQNKFIHGEVNILSCSTTFELGVDVGDLQAVVMRNVPPTTANYVQRAGRAGRRTDSAAFALTFAQRRSHDLYYYNRPSSIVAGKIKPPVAMLTNEKIVRRHLHSVVFAAFFRWAKEKHGQDYRKTGKFFAPEDGTAGPKLVTQFLEERPEQLQQALRRVLPADLHKDLGVESWSWMSRLTSTQEDGLLDKARLSVTTELDEFQQLEYKAANNRKYKQADNFRRVQNQIRDRDLLGFLATHNVLPKYGFPTDVVELKTNHLQSIGEARKIELARDLRMAISEFAPGGEVVAAKKVWLSRGIRRLPNRAWEPYNYVVCGYCHRFYHAVSDLPDQCQCGKMLSDHPEMRGKFIIPEHGFIAGKATRSPGETPPQRIYSSRVFFADYLLPGTEEKEDKPLIEEQTVSSSRAQINKRYSRHGWLAVVNNGWGLGFQICGACGYTEPVSLPPSASRQSAHENPLNGKSCNSTFVNYHLGHRFMTDVLELRTTLSNLGNIAANSLLYGLLDGASEALGISRNDIEGTVYQLGLGQPPAMVLYDNVPGGAGHVARIYDNLRPTLEAARERLDRCECGEETSCYNCLRNYRNQYYHDDLQRGSALQSLRTLLGSKE